ncbi:hypothetical protein [Streptomyces sp. NRRL F-5135]|uniref:hypothetical protein n=1 Tax=Streptomyces sp. NRRL F-5135 TaxID=1463858 RepID=UPI00131CC5B2|nr:hypothetical protein [Streptomyces sp. NRRL F-5135]
MRRVSGVGAVVVAAVLLVSGCGGSSGGSEGSGPGGETSSPAAVPESSGPGVEESEESFPATPEGDVDRLASEKGWVVDDLYPAASDFVADICASLPESAADSSSRPQWLAESGVLEGDGKAVLLAGIPKLCPKWEATLKEAVSGDYERWVSSGEYEVKAGPADAGADVLVMPAGTYRTVGALADCYWERTSEDGQIIDNQFATQARRITVTVQTGELFKSEQCGTWKPVK